MAGDNTSLGERMKWYENRFADEFMPMVPIIARLDGRSFHNFTKGLKRPYDERLSSLMTQTTAYLVSETNARCGYTQSDEISLVWLADDWDNEVFFAGKLQKMNSILSAMCSVYFNRNLGNLLPEKEKEMPLFDCRVFQVPNETEAVNCFIWREMDASRNSVQMAARAHYSHNECMNKDTGEMLQMLKDKGIDWNDYPGFFKRGSYLRRLEMNRPFDATELASLPEKHHARLNPDLIVKRSSVVCEHLEPMAKIANREDVVFRGAKIVLKPEEN